MTNEEIGDCNLLKRGPGKTLLKNIHGTILGEESKPQNNIYFDFISIFKTTNKICMFLSMFFQTCMSVNV